MAEESSNSKVDPKICRVCGDRALGYNFNAITCESCKAFFRRNALKIKTFKCPFDNNCKVDVITRRFCQKCRLDKCMTIGMKKEWIMTEEEKKVKRAKINENRQKKGSSVSNNGPFSDESSLPSPQSTAGSKRSYMNPTSPSESECSPPPAKVIHLDSNDGSSLHLSEAASPTFCSNTIDYETCSQDSGMEIKKERSGSEIMTDLIQASSPTGSLIHYSSLMTPSPQTPDHSPTHQISEALSPAYPRKSGCSRKDEVSIKQETIDIAVEMELMPVSIRPFGWNSRQLTPLEQSKLDELTVANEVLKLPLVMDISDPSLVDVINMTDHAIRRLIKMSKKIVGFKNLCQEDQIALLKGSCTELMILRSAMTYDHEQNCWQGLQDPRYKSVKVDVLKEASGDLYEQHKRFIMSFDPLWRSNESIMLLLGAITLFFSERPNTVHRAAIKMEQSMYFYLLRRYLFTLYPACEARTTYLKLIQKLQELHDLNENHIRILLDVNPNDVEPLLIEIFDLKPLHKKR